MDEFKIGGLVDQIVAGATVDPASTPEQRLALAAARDLVVYLLTNVGRIAAALEDLACVTWTVANRD